MKTRFNEKTIMDLDVHSRMNQRQADRLGVSHVNELVQGRLWE